jgi:hypothetical protein
MGNGTDITSLILSEVQALRSDVAENAVATGERLSALETSMKALLGNGQPGRITGIEDAVRDLQAWRWKMLGICTGASSVVSVIGYLILHH